MPRTIAAYDDCLKYFEDAQKSERGIRVWCPGGEREANHLRFRLNYARVLEREESQRLYPRDDHRWGKSVNDRFRFTVRAADAADSDVAFWVYIEPWVATINDVEEL